MQGASAWDAAGESRVSDEVRVLKDKTDSIQIVFRYAKRERERQKEREREHINDCQAWWMTIELKVCKIKNYISKNKWTYNFQNCKTQPCRKPQRVV